MNFRFTLVAPLLVLLFLSACTNQKPVAERADYVRRKASLPAVSITDLNWRKKSPPEPITPTPDMAKGAEAHDALDGEIYAQMAHHYSDPQIFYTSKKTVEEEEGVFRVESVQEPGTIKIRVAP